jgi:hypothetical protein
MNTYLGDVVLDPFMGSGTTAVAAVRTGRHFVGYDTDASYVQAALDRVRRERPAPLVHVSARDGRLTDPVEGGWSAKELARSMLVSAGFTGIDDTRSLLPGVQPTLAAVGSDGGRWWFEVVGGRTSSRPGAQRVELLWRAIAKGSVVAEVDPAARFVVLTTSLPSAASGGRALAAVTGPGRPIAAVVDITTPRALAELRDVHMPKG